MNSQLLSTAELATRLNDAVKEAFTFPFSADNHCKPDTKMTTIYDSLFHLNDHLVVLYGTTLFPGITFRALDVNTGDLNVITQNVKFEVDIPTVGGFFYLVSEDKSVKPVHIRGAFKIKYDTAIVKGTVSYFMYRGHLRVSSMAVDFQLTEKPKVVLYSHEADGSMGELDSDRAANGAKIAEEMWPNVEARLYSSFRNKIWDVLSKLLWNDSIARNDFRIQGGRRRAKVAEVANEIIIKLKRKLRATTVGGRLAMPDIDVMVAREGYPDIWGRFKATSGWLGDIASIRLSKEFAVHARSKNELVILGEMHFNDLKYCYDEYTMESDTGNAIGDILRTLHDSEAFIEITAIRDENGKIIQKHGRFKYIGSWTSGDVMGLGNYCDWLNPYIRSWMHGLMNTRKPVLNDAINKCLNEVLEEIDLFGYWDELCAQGLEDDIADVPENEYDVSDNDSIGSWTAN